MTHRVLDYVTPVCMVLLRLKHGGHDFINHLLEPQLLNCGSALKMSYGFVSIIGLMAMFINLVCSCEWK